MPTQASQSSAPKKKVANGGNGGKAAKKAPKKAPVKKKGAEPLPTDKGDPESKEASDRAAALAKQQNEAKEKEQSDLDKEIKEMEAKLKAKLEEKKKEKKAKQEAAKKAKDEALAERKKKLEAREAAEKRVKEAEEALEATEEAVELKKAREALAKIGPIPKVGSGGTRRVKAAGALNGSEIRAMDAIMDAGKALTRRELTEITGQTKGWSKLLGTKEGGNGGLCDRGYLAIQQHEEGPMVYDLTSEGRTVLEKAKEEAAKS